MKLKHGSASWPVMLVIVTLFAACRTDEPIAPAADPASATVRLHMVPQWEDAPFALFTEYRAPFNYRCQAELLRMYLSDLRLVNGDDEQVVNQVELLDLGSGEYTIELKAPAGTWTGMRAGLGLPPELNHSDPSLYGSAHPMSVFTGMTWNIIDGYRFMVFDGRYDPDPLSTEPLIQGFSLHTGFDTCYTTLQLFPPVPFRTAKDSVTELTLRIAVDGFLGTVQDTLDLAIEHTSHMGNMPLAMKITRNVARSIHLE